MCAESYSRSRLRVVADSDSGVIARVLERFQNLNVLPRRVHVELGSNDLLHIEVECIRPRRRPTKIHRDKSDSGGMRGDGLLA